MKFVSLPGDGIGPEISESTIQVLEVRTRAARTGHHVRDPRDRVPVGTARPFRRGADAARAADGMRFRPGVPFRLSVRDKAVSTGRHTCASSSTFTPISSLPLARGYPKLWPHAFILRHCAREYGRLLRRSHHVHGHGRVDAYPRRRRRDAQGEGQGFAAHRQGRFRARAHAASAEADLRGQGQRA